MTERRVLWRIRGAVLATLALMAAYVIFLTNPHYNLNDDMILLRAMSGAVGGVTDGFNYLIHTFLRRILQGLSLVFPTVAWFSVAQVGMLVLCGYVTVESGMLAASRRGQPLWLGWLIGAGFAAAFVMPNASSVTFTMTAAVLGASAVWQLWAIDWKHPGARSRFELGRSLLLLCLCMSIRRQAALPAGAFWFGVLLWQLLARRTDWRIVARAAAIGALALVVMLGVQLAENRLSGEQAYLDWQDASGVAIDYGGFSVADEAILQQNGWTENEMRLAENWCFLDAGMTTEALYRTGEAMAHSAPLSDVIPVLQRLLARSRNIYWACMLLLSLCALAVLRRGLWQRLAAVFCGVAALAMLVYLAWVGRLPMRAAATVLYPACALGVGFAWPDALRLPKGALRRMLALAVAALCAATLGFNLRFAWNSTFNPGSRQMDFVHTRVERYALEHPGELVIGTPKLGMSWQLFPDWSAGKPANLLFNWGSWNYHSAGYRAVFSAFGYEHDAFEIQNFLDQPLRLATAQGEPPPQILLSVMAEQSGSAVESILCHEEDGFCVYRFQKQTEGGLAP